jgi:fumarate reductase flavoprotein subunit
MFDYDERGERATRDIVSRGIYDEMRKGNTSPHGGVYISMSHLGPAEVRKKFSGMVKRCADCGFDLAGGRVEVVPTAHYYMGGVICDPDTHTEMPGLYVAGEDAGGAHGANRLGGNGVANSTVYGGVAGDVMGSEALSAGPLRDPDEALIEAEIARARYPFSKKPGDIHGLRERLMDIMWEDVGVMRTGDGLRRGIDRVNELKAEFLETGLHDRDTAFNLTWHDWLNLRSLIEISDGIAKSALWRENSRGAHFREDFPDQGEFESSYFTVARQKDDAIQVEREQVAFTIVKPGETLLEEQQPAEADDKS